MRWLLLPVALLAAAAAFLLPAQTAAPNAAGVSFGHIHLYPADAAAMKKLLVDLLKLLVEQNNRLLRSFTVCNFIDSSSYRGES